MKIATVAEIAKQVRQNTKSAKEHQGRDKGTDIPDPTNKGATTVKNDEGDAGGGPIRHFQSDNKNSDASYGGNSATPAGDSVGASDATRPMPSTNKAKDGTKSTGDGPSSFKVATDFKAKTAKLLESLKTAGKCDKGAKPPKKDQVDPKTAGASGDTGGGDTTDSPDLNKIPATPEKVAQYLADNFGENYHRKLAAALLQDEDGMKIAQARLEEYVGAEAAEALVKESKEAAEAYEQYGRELTEGEEQAREYWNSLSPAQKKVAQAINLRHEKAVEGLEYDFEKQAYGAGAQDMMGLQGGPMAGGVPDEELMIPGGAAGEPTEEEIIEEIMAMIEQGLISPEEGEAMIEEILSQSMGMMQEGAKAANEKVASIVDTLLKDD